MCWKRAGRRPSAWVSSACRSIRSTFRTSSSRSSRLGSSGGRTSCTGRAWCAATSSASLLTWACATTGRLWLSECKSTSQSATCRSRPTR
eukprot:3027966-Prymnesium_polylepis.1